MKSCISDVISLLSDLIEARDLMIPLNVRKHLGEKLQTAFAILHHLEVNKTESKGKEKLFSSDPIIDNKEEEELYEAELKRRKAREAEMDEHQCIIRKAEAKEKAEKEA
ncbi:unnamed protein product [Lactuca saligna]|uniref:Uncharacterized protein n=1 Tax=Lactuca saligna TaxID=75948 RepID=A0AA36DUJ4_LACSI|nr:unnamed protein product [Lactuca saligna]